MKNFFKKLSFVLAVAMVLTSITPATASAAAKNYIYKSGKDSALTSVNVWFGDKATDLNVKINGKKNVAGTWKVGNTKVATVDKNGVITPVANGTTTVKFTAKTGEAVKVQVVVGTRVKTVKPYLADDAEKTALTELALNIGDEKEIKLGLGVSATAAKAGAKTTSMVTAAKVDGTAVEVVKGAGQRTFTVKAVEAGEATITIGAHKTTALVEAGKFFKSAEITVTVADKLAAKQTGVKKITVTGSELTDQVADYTLKRGNVTVDLASATLDSNTSSVVLTAKASKLTAGEYTLKFKESDTITIIVEEGKTASIDIPSDTLPLDDEYTRATTATVGYKVLNQFGEDITKTVSTITVTSSFGSAEVSNTNNTITVTFPVGSKPMIGAAGTMVVVDTTTGVNFNKTLTLGMEAKADVIEVLGVYNTITGEKMDIRENSANANAAILVKVSNQYGGAMAKLDCKDEVAFTFTGGLTNIAVEDTKEVFSETVTIDGVTYVAIPLVATGVKAGTAQGFFVSTSTGKTAEVTITVGANATIKSIDVYPLDSVYGGANEENEFGFTALTEDGTEVKDYDTLTSQYAFSSDISTKYGDFYWRKNTDGSAKLVFITDDEFDATIGDNKSLITSATFVTAGYGTKTITFSILAPAVPTSIGGTKDVTLGVLNDGSTANNVDFVPGKNLVIYDQYGRAMDSGYSDYAVKVVPLYDADSSDVIAATTSAAVDGNKAKLDKIDKYTFTTTTGAITKAYTEKYELTLVDPSGEDVEGSSYTMAVSTAPMGALTRFSLATVSDLYDYSKDENGNDEESHTVKPSVTGYTAGNIAISIPNTELTLTAGDGLQVVNVSGTDCFSASGAAAFISDYGVNPTAVSKKTTVMVTVDNATGTQLTQEVTASIIPPMATTVISKSVTNVSVSAVSTMDNVLAKLTWVVKDQYGKVYGSIPYVGNITTADTKTIQISNITDVNYVKATPFTVTKNNTSSATITNAAAGDSFVITATLKSGVVITTVVTVVAD